MSALRVVDLSVRFGGNVAVDAVSLAVEAGEVVGLIGPNGAGKTTLVDAVSGFAPVSSGRIEMDEVDLSGLLPYQRARKGLARSFQDARLWPTMTVREALVCGFHPEVATGVWSEGLRLPRVRRAERAVHERAMALLDLVDLSGYLDHLISELSFGTTRAVELAWMAARRPRVLLLDEPASGLQQSEVRVLGALVHAIRGDAAVLVIDHDVPFVSGISDRMVAMHLGAVVAQGAPHDVLDDAAVIESYLGSGRYAGRSRR